MTAAALAAVCEILRISASYITLDKLILERMPKS